VSFGEENQQWSPNASGEEARDLQSHRLPPSYESERLKKTDVLHGANQESAVRRVEAGSSEVAA
jgi:hypothetical protein